LAVIVRTVLALVLLVAAASKLARPRAAGAALATFGIRDRLRVPAIVGLAATEAALATGAAVGVDAAAYGAAALLGLFAAVLFGALRSGRRGLPCGCFGARSRVSGHAVARNLALAAGFATVPALPRELPGTRDWLLLGLVAAFACIGVLAVAVLALAREVGLLRVRLAPESALEVADEGPPVGARVGLLERFDATGARFALAVFSSEGCRLCEALSPAIAAFRRHPLVALEVFDEARDADVWRELRIPGSPFAVALDRDGAVRAKGTFNSYGQLESILATAERRLAEGHA
jgi:hypothetical protein